MLMCRVAALSVPQSAVARVKSETFLETVTGKFPQEFHKMKSKTSGTISDKLKTGYKNLRYKNFD